MNPSTDESTEVTARLRRAVRRPLVVAAMLISVLILLAAGLYYRQTHRPLNETEAALVGRWEHVERKGAWFQQNRLFVELRADRTMRSIAQPKDVPDAQSPMNSGTWRASATTITFRDDAARFWNAKEQYEFEWISDAELLLSNGRERFKLRRIHADGNAVTVP